MRKILLSAFAVTLFVFVLVSCKKDKHDHSDFPIPSNLKLLASGYATGASARIDVYAADSFFAGYNKLYLAVYDSVNNERISEGHIYLSPMMSMMGGMNHSSPFENPVSEDAVNGLFECAVVFIMPSSMGNTWKLDIRIHNHHNNQEGTASLDVHVKQPALSLMKPITTIDDSSKLFVSVVTPLVPKVGVNDYEITIHKRESMMSFPAANDYTTVVNPQMLSMGHGSPFNENPVLTANGHYKGKVNFTMSGDWRVFLQLNRNGAVADSTLYFDVIVP